VRVCGFCGVGLVFFWGGGVGSWGCCFFSRLGCFFFLFFLFLGFFWGLFVCFWGWGLFLSGCFGLGVVGFFFLFWFGFFFFFFFGFWRVVLGGFGVWGFWGGVGFGFFCCFFFFLFFFVFPGSFSPKYPPLSDCGLSFYCEQVGERFPFGCLPPVKFSSFLCFGSFLVAFVGRFLNALFFPRRYFALAAFFEGMFWRAFFNLSPRSVSFFFFGFPFSMFSRGFSTAFDPFPLNLSHP